MPIVSLQQVAKTSYTKSVLFMSTVNQFLPQDRDHDQKRVLPDHRSSHIIISALCCKKLRHLPLIHSSHTLRDIYLAPPNIHMQPMDANTVLQNERGDVVAIVTDIHHQQLQAAESESNVNAANAPQSNVGHLLSTSSNQAAQVLPLLIVDEQTQSNDNKPEAETETKVDTEMGAAGVAPSSSRWTKENRETLKRLMCDLPARDIGAALRVILDTFGVESSKLVRRGEFVELDLLQIRDDYVLDSLWNYCAQIQFNLINTLQQQSQSMQMMPVAVNLPPAQPAVAMYHPQQQQPAYVITPTAHTQFTQNKQ